MSEILALYLFTRLDNIITLAGVIVIAGGMAAAWVAFFALCDSESYSEKSRERSKLLFKYAKRTGIAATIAALTTVLIPSQKDTMFIVAGIGVLEAAKTETAQRVAGKAVAIVEKAMDEYMGEKK